MEGRVKVIGAAVLAVAAAHGPAVVSKPPEPPASLPAFPGAEGYGAGSLGGRGGRVITVTTLDPDGLGSLQWACDQKGPRIIVFAVSGVIRPPNRSSEGRWLSIKEGRVTIAGQTAPGAGITIEGMLSTSRGRRGTDRRNVPDVVVRFVRLRPTFGRGNLRTLETRSSRRFIADHVSGSWSLDQCFNAGGDAEDITFQWCAIEETDIGLEGSQPHAFGLFGSYNKTGNTTVHHCLLAHHMGRAPDFDENYHVDFRNNLLYNVGFDETVMRWFNRSKTPGRPYGLFNVVGNTWRTGPGGLLGIRTYMPPLSRSRPGFVPRDRRGRHYFIGNRFEDDGLVGPEKYTGASAKLLVAEPFSTPPVVTHTADEAYELVLAQTGCLPPDAVSARTMAEVRSRTGGYGRHWPNSGLMEGLTPGQAAPDSDADGMPDDWEKAHGLHSDDPADATKTVPAGTSPGDRHKGYTYIEYYINDRADRLVAEALTRARLKRQRPRPWPNPATTLSPDQTPHETLEDMEDAVRQMKNVKEVNRAYYTAHRLASCAVQQLNRLGDAAAPAVPGLIEALNDRRGNAAAVSVAAWALGAIGHAARPAVPHLIRAIKREQNTRPGKWSWRTYGFLAWALGRIGLTDEQAKEAVPAFVKMLHGPDDRSRPSAAWALSRLGRAAQPAMPALLQALSSGGGAGTDVLAARALANIGVPAIQDMVKSLSSGNETVWTNVARALGWIGPAAADAAAVLIKRLKEDQSGVVRGRAAEALARIAPRNAEVASALAAALSDPFLDVRVSAATALGRRGLAAHAVPALVGALADARPEVRRAAALALGRARVGGVSALRQALSSQDPLVRKYAARALRGRRGAPRMLAGSIEALVGALADPTAEVRREAVWSLAVAGSAAAGAAETLKKALDDDDYVVRYAAGEALKAVSP